MMDKYFEYRKNKTNFKTEVIAGVTTWMTLSYIFFLNPFIMSGEFKGTEAGFFDYGATFTATVWATAIACFIMAFLGKVWPIGLSVGLGINAYLVYGVVKGMGYTPEEALGAVFVAGVIFLGISLTPLRAWLVNSVPKSLKLGIGCGVGLFLGIIALEIMKIVVDHPITLVTLGNLKDPLVLLGCGAFISMVVLEKYNIKGNIIIALLVFSLISWITGLGKFNGIASMPPSMDYFLAFDLGAALSAGMISIVFTLLFIDFFDTMGTLTAVAAVTGKIEKNGKIKNIDKAMLADSGGTVIGSCLGVSTITSFIESGSGVKAGGRTGMVSLVVGVLSLACLFISPLATSLPAEIDGAALLFVSILFVKNIVHIEWNDITESAPAILAMVTMPLTYSIANGIAIGFISLALIKIFTGQFNKTSPAVWVIAVLSVISFYVA